MNKNVNAAEFTLTRAHVELIQRLNLKIFRDETYDNFLVPGIDDKRPFGNSFMLGDILNVMGEKPDADGNFSEEQKTAAYLLLAELPAAYQAMMENATFFPGTYLITRSAGLLQTMTTKNYVRLIPFLTGVKANPRTARYFEQVRHVCRVVMGEDPIASVRNVLRGFRANARNSTEKEDIDAMLVLLSEKTNAPARDAQTADSGPKNTRIAYMYRDGDNYKCSNEIIIPGRMDENQITRLITSLDEGEYFIPQQVDMPANDMTSLGYAFDPQSDHPWFTLYASGIEPTCQEPTENVTPEELVAKFEKAAADGWDESLWEHENEAEAIKEDDEEDGE